MKLKMGNLVYVVPDCTILVWEHEPPAGTISWLELHTYHEYYGIYLSSRNNKHYIIMSNRCFEFWKHDFVIRCTITKAKYDKS